MAILEEGISALVDAVSPQIYVQSVGKYLSAVARALKLKNDASLCKVMGVHASTFASWKARGDIPERHRVWLRENLLWKVLAANDDLPECGLTARATLIEVIARAAEKHQIRPDPRMMGPLLALAQLLSRHRGCPGQHTVS